MKKFCIVFFLIALTLPYVPAYADTVNCNGGIISIGDRDIDVMSKCGSPDLNTRRKASRYVEEWTYNFGPQELMRIIVIRNGVVAEIKNGNYGYVKK